MAWDLWCALDSQWRLVAGMAGAIWQAPDHANAVVVMECHGIKKKRRRRYLDELVGMYREALAVLNDPDARGTS